MKLLYPEFSGGSRRYGDSVGGGRSEVNRPISLPGWEHGRKIKLNRWCLFQAQGFAGFLSDMLLVLSASFAASSSLLLHHLIICLVIGE